MITTLEILPEQAYQDILILVNATIQVQLLKLLWHLLNAFNCTVNDLPLSIVLSWFEQKAVAVLLGLFSLGVKNIYIGPKPPEFLSSGVVKVLQDTFNLKLTGEPLKDLKEMLG